MKVQDCNDNHLVKPGSEYGRFSVLFLCLAVLVLLATLLLSAAVGPYSQDPDYFTYVGRCIADGRRLYLDIWDCKGPFVYWLSAVGALLGPVMGHQIVGACAWLLAFALVFLLARRFCGAYSGLAVFLFAVFSLGMSRFGTTGRQESVAACFVASGMILGLGRRNGLWCFGAGVCAGVVFMIKPTLLMFVPAIGCWWAAKLYRDRDWGAFAGSCALAVAGGVAVFLVTTAFFLPDGVSELWRSALLWNLTDRSAHSIGLFKYWKLVMSTKSFLANYGWTILVWAVCYIVAIGLVVRSRSRNMAFLLLWSSLEAVAAFGYPGYCAHYVIMAFLPLAVAICCGLGECERGTPAHVVSLFVAGAAVCFTVGWSCPRISRHIANCSSRQASLADIRNELVSAGGGVAVYGANRTASVMNAIDALSGQRFPGIMFWIASTTPRFRAELAEDFRRVADDSRTNMLLVERKCSLDDICALTGWEGRGMFRLWRDFPELEVAVYTKCEKDGARTSRCDDQAH